MDDLLDFNQSQKELDVEKTMEALLDFERDYQGCQCGLDLDDPLYTPLLVKAAETLGERLAELRR